MYTLNKITPARCIFGATAGEVFQTLVENKITEIPVGETKLGSSKKTNDSNNNIFSTCAMHKYPHTKLCVNQLTII